MSDHIRVLIRLETAFHRFAASIRMASLVLLLLVLSRGANALGTNGKAQGATSCAFSDAQFDTATDVHALDEYRDAIAKLLKEEKFSDLDCLADSARSGKTRFSGGGWKLRNLYIGLDSPRPGHPTAEDWLQHLELVERWVRKNSQSITAPIALAESYVSYAWDARGEGFADTVSDSGWKLFAERLAKAKAILDEASASAQKCPDWYLAMQLVARGQSWDLPKATALFEQAAAFEPAYQYYYRTYANYLLPQWSGEEGDASRFAEESANRVGGEAGDALYYLIAEKIVCGCKDREFGHFSWPRLQAGFTALEKKYGPSLNSVNSFALMATNANDWVTSDSAFKRIGDNWDKETWRTRDWFTQNRDAAAQMAPLQVRVHAIHQEALANMQTPEGQAYLKNVEQKFAAFEEPCLKETDSDQGIVEMQLRIAKDGAVELAQTEQRTNAFTVCVMRGLYQSFLKKETPFTPPPRASYWLLLDLDPTRIVAGSH